MENKNKQKPVPNVPELEYKGTADKPDIKIFVSHRIDWDAKTIDNPLYVPVRCGAVYDERKNVTMLGDDTGDNISEKRNTFNEFTVMYWTWKNVKADYYGLCHYRRYLSFSDEEFPTTNDFLNDDVDSPAPAISCIPVETINKENERKFCLTESSMRNCIEPNDLIYSFPIDLRNSNFVSIEDFILRHNRAFIYSDYEILRDIVYELYPEWKNEFYIFFSNPFYSGYSCFIMKKEIFSEYCKWLFDILFELEKRTDISSYTDKQKRIYGYYGELLTGLYINHVVNKNSYKTKCNQIIVFRHTGRNYKKATTAKKVLRAFFPYGTKSYAALKGAYYKIRGWPYDPKSDLREFHDDPIFLKPLKRIFPSSAKISKWRHSVLVDLFYATNSNIALFRQRNEQIKNDINKNSLLNACWANWIADLHKETFRPYKYCLEGQDAVLLTTGPTLNFYEPIENVKHIGVNAAFKFDKCKLDYYIVADCYRVGKEWSVDQLKELECQKFLGIYWDRYVHESGGTEYLARQINAKRFIFKRIHQIKEIPLNIDFFPVFENSSVASIAMHIILYMHPKRIFIVGNDASTVGGEHFDNSTGGITPLSLLTNGIIESYKMLKKHIDDFYPEIEIYVVNPIGLKGMFNDVYTKNYLDTLPENERVGCKLLDDMLCKEEHNDSKK